MEMRQWPNADQEPADKASAGNTDTPPKREPANRHERRKAAALARRKQVA